MHSARYIAAFALALAAGGAAPPPLPAPSTASAQATQQCLDDYERGQRLRLGGSLRAARDAFISCSNTVCPKPLNGDCARWLGEVEAEIPSIVLSAMTADGRDVVEVRVSIDGTPVAERLDGKAIALDPGEHWFRFEAAGHSPVERKFLVRQGEKGRAIAAEFPTVRPPRSSRVLPYLLGGVGFAGLASFAWFGMHGRSVQSDLDDRGCKPRCPQGDVDEMNRSYLVANISLAVGIASLGGATYLLLRDRPVRPPPPEVSVGLFGVRAGMMGSVGGTF